MECIINYDSFFVVYLRHSVCKGDFCWQGYNHIDAFNSRKILFNEREIVTR